MISICDIYIFAEFLEQRKIAREIGFGKFVYLQVSCVRSSFRKRYGFSFWRNLSL